MPHCQPATPARTDSGHTHAYEHFVSVGGDDLHYIVTGGAGGYEHYPVGPVPGNLVYSEYDFHYVQIYVGARSIIYVRVRDPKGVEMESFRIYD